MPHKRAKRSIRDKMRSERSSDLPPSQNLVASSMNDMPKSMTRVLNAETVRKAWKEKKRQLEDVQDGRGGKEGSGKKRRAKEDGESMSKEKRILIKPGESLVHFERRVEDDMRPLVRSAMTAVNSISRKKRKEVVQDGEKMKEEKSHTHAVASLSSSPSKKGKEKATVEDVRPDMSSKAKGRKEKPTEFATISSSAPKRLNDIAQAPPELKAPRLKTKNNAFNTGNDSDNMEALDTTVKKRAGSRNSKLDILSPAQRRMMELERERAVKRYRMLKEAKLKAKARVKDGKGSLV